jgi:phthalate 4,5-cis-dihydrodiol dehydrogenase
MLPTFRADPRVRVVAGTDPRPEARAQLAQDFGARSHASVEELVADGEVEAVYIASPHQFHARHVALAAAAGKHVLVEKPMAISLEQATTMIEAARRAGTALIVGHSHSFDRPVLRAREWIASGDFGAVRMISAMNYTDFLYRPRRPEELDTAQGGGALFSQAAHQVDIVRLLGGGKVRSVRAHTGAWDPRRSTEGAYAATLDFGDGLFASLVYSGYGRFDTDEMCGNIGEMGQPADPALYGRSRRLLSQASDPGTEAALKMARNYGGAASGAGTGGLAEASGGATSAATSSGASMSGAAASGATASGVTASGATMSGAAASGAAASADASAGRSGGVQTWHQHFGLVIASCEHADLRPLPTGVMIYEDSQVRLDALAPPTVPRIEVIDELYAAVVQGSPPRHDGIWGMATLEVCLALLHSAQEGHDVALRHQCAWRDHG